MTSVKTKRKQRGGFMDTKQAINLRKVARNDGLSDAEFHQVLHEFYNYYMHKKEEFVADLEYFKGAGVGADGSINIGITALLRSTPNAQVLLSRIPMIYKTLTALYATPYQVALILQKYLEAVKLRDIRILVGSENEPHASPTSGIRKLIPYSMFPEYTSVAVYNNTIHITLLQNV